MLTRLLGQEFRQDTALVACLFSIVCGASARGLDGWGVSMLGTENIQTSSFTSQPVDAGWCLGLWLGQLTRAFTGGFSREPGLPHNIEALKCISYIKLQKAVSYWTKYTCISFYDLALEVAC